MNGWGSVLWGYGIVGVALGVYLWTLVSRAKAARRRLDDLG